MRALTAFRIVPTPISDLTASIEESDFERNPWTAQTRLVRIAPLCPHEPDVSVKRPMDNSTKIWLTRNGGCLLAHNKGQIPPKDLRDIMDVVTFNHKLICDEWCKRFQGDISFYE